MSTTVALALIATTLASIAALTWATIHYVPAVLHGDDHGEEHADAGAH